MGWKQFFSCYRSEIACLPDGTSHARCRQFRRGEHPPCRPAAANRAAGEPAALAGPGDYDCRSGVRNGRQRLFHVHLPGPGPGVVGRRTARGTWTPAAGGPAGGRRRRPIPSGKTNSCQARVDATRGWISCLHCFVSGSAAGSRGSHDRRTRFGNRHYGPGRRTRAEGLCAAPNGGNGRHSLAHAAGGTWRRG